MLHFDIIIAYYYLSLLYIYASIIMNINTHMLHVCYIYQHLPSKSPTYVGKYTIHGAYGI